VLDTLPCKLPTEYIPDDADPAAIATPFVGKLIAGSLDLQDFVSHALWRDSFALTSSLRTFYSGTTVATTWKKLNKVRKTTSFQVEAASAVIRRIQNEVFWIELPFVFETGDSPATSCQGFLSLVPCPDATWRIWILRTILDQLEGCSDVDILKPIVEAGEQLVIHPTNGHCHQQQHYDCVVVGAGQGGLSSAGRLKALGLSYVLIDRNPEVGDNWMLRYDSARLHTTREYAHLPYDRTFTPEYQEYLTKYDLARGYKSWVAKFGIVSAFCLSILVTYLHIRNTLLEYRLMTDMPECHALDKSKVWIVGRIQSNMAPQPSKSSTGS
jgi:hypothetical protein